MTEEAILERVKVVFGKVFGRDDLVITRAMKADDVKGWDSMTQIRLLIGIEREFKTKFQSSEALRLKNVGEILDLIAAKVKA